ncbi:MAG: hypothetical protein J6Q82_06605 [Clostridia bacterium]|nr:hypothetical protein [Clostridia bacterium]
MDLTKEQQIFKENIRIFSERSAISERQRELSLDLCINALLAEKESDPLELYARFSSNFPSNSTFTSEDRAKFFARLAKSAPHQKTMITQTSFRDDESTQSGAHGRIALVRNRYNEEAFAIFDPFVQGAKAEFLSSFSDACEEVFDNLCEFCILPIENTESGRLFGFYSMLDRYELKICATCTVEHDDSPDTVRYALVGKRLPHRIPKNTEWNLEYCVSAESAEFPYDIFRVAPIFEATPIKIDSLPILYDDGAHRIYFTFRLPRAMAYAFDLYLSSEHPRYTAIGLYPILNH